MKQWMVGLFVSGLATVVAETPSVLAIRNAKVFPVSGPAIARGTVVVRNGLIEAVGENIPVPADAWVIEGEGLNVYPGLIDALSTWGMPETPTTGAASGAPTAPTRTVVATPPTPTAPQTAPRTVGPEDRPSNTSWQHAADLVRPTDRRIEQARSAGFTTAITFPTAGIFAGQGAAINLAGDKPGQMVLSSPMGLHLSMGGGRGFGNSFPGSLMGVIAYIRQIYLDADYYQKAKESYGRNPRGIRRPDYDRALEGVLEAQRILLPATGKVEIERMLRFATELRRSAVLYGVHEGYRAVDAIKSSGAPVLVNLRWPERSRDGDPDEEESLRVLEMREKAPSTPAALSKAGVQFAFYSGGIERPGDIGLAVKRALDAGLSPDEAVRALTLSAAQIYGLADRLGSIESGKIANLVVTRGDLFQEKTRVEYVLIDGVKFQPAAEAPSQAEEGAR